MTRRHKSIVLIAAFSAISAAALLAITRAGVGTVAVYTDSLSLTQNVQKCSTDSTAGGGTFIAFGTNCDGTNTPSQQPPQVASVRIATLGDSNTVSGFWRKPFQAALRASGCNYDMIGQEAISWGNIDLAGFDRDTDASSGAVIATFRNPSNAIFEKGKATLASKNANVVYVIGGTNDIKGLNPSNQANLATLTKTISETKKHLLSAATLSPDAYFIVTSVVQIRGQETVVNWYNTALEKAVNELSSQMKIQFISVATNGSDVGTDAVHFTTQGGEKFGKAVAAGSLDLIEQFGACGANEETPTPPTSTSKCITDKGYVNPTEVCVGRTATTALQDYTQSMQDTKSYTISQDNAVIENKRIIGCVTISGKNVTLRNNYIECYRSRDINGSGSPYLGNGPVTVNTSATNAKVENNDIVCKMKNTATAACDYGIFLGAGAARYNDISGSVDGIDPRSNVTIEYNYIHSFGTAYEEWRNDYSHADGVQMYSANTGNISIVGNYFNGTRAPNADSKNNGLQAILIQASSGSSSKPDIVIKNNAVIGEWASLRISCISGASCNVEDNVFDNRYKNSTWVVQLSGSHGASSAKCNSFADGSLLQSSNIKDGNAMTSGC